MHFNRCVLFNEVRSSLVVWLVATAAFTGGRSALRALSATPLPPRRAVASGGVLPFPGKRHRKSSQKSSFWVDDQAKGTGAAEMWAAAQ